MEHELSLITTLAASFAIALALGFIAERLRTPALVGYLLAGILIGPMTPGLVVDVEIARQLSEIGVMLLMFGVGLHFSLGDLMAVKRIAIPGAVAQMGLAALLGAGFATLWGWTPGEALVFGLSLSCASTVVLLKALEARGALESTNGRIAVGWLVVEDLATVLILVLLPPLAGLLSGKADAAADTPLLIALVETLLHIAAFIVVMLLAGRRVIPWLLWQVARTGSRELFTLSVVAAAIGIAYGAAIFFHVSFALGAFFAGMVMRESEFSQRAAEESLPLRDAFSVLFFVAVGMLFNPAILRDAPFKVAFTAFIILFGKSFAAAALTLAFRYPLNTALTVAASLAQIGEFSFILGGLGRALGLVSDAGMNLILAGALISIALNPLVFAAIGPLQEWLLRRSALARRLNQREDPYAQLPAETEQQYVQGHVVLAGYGRVARRIAHDLTERGIPYVVIGQTRETVEALRRQGVAAVYGDAAAPETLVQAHIAHAALLVVATPDTLDVRRMAEIARALNPGIEIVARTHNDDEARLLRGEGVGVIFHGAEELAKNMSRYVLERFPPAGKANQD
ncbi:MAG: cation:proton antiporter [Candidatus Accumulibacter sp.]|jgi:CPA2 family monovalent cation:H+ antiporter-2|nr:cation:proton antiporter [Accumulibacter sp.]